MNPSINKKIIKGVISGAGLTIITTIVTLIQIRLVFDFLPKDIAGMWFLFLTLGMYIAFFDLGISPTIAREISFVLGDITISTKEHFEKIADLIATNMRIFQVLALGTFILSISIGGLYLLYISPAGKHNEIIIAWFIFTLGASANFLGSAWLSALYGLGNVSSERIIRALAQIAGLGLSALFLYMGFGLIGLASAWVLQNLMMRLISWIILYRHHPILKSNRGTPRMSIVKRIFTPSIKWAITSFGAILILQTDNIIIASTLGVSAIPQYEAVVKIIATLASLTMLLTATSSPFLSQAFAAGNTVMFNSILFRNIRYIMALTLVLVSFLAFFMDKIVNIWLGTGNFVGFPIVWVLLIMITLEIHHVIMATATMSAGHIVFYKVALLAGIINIIVSLILVQYFGLLGIAMGTMIAQILTNNWYVPYVTLKTFNIPCISYFTNTLLPIILFGFIIMFITFIMQNLTQIYNDMIAVIFTLPILIIFGAILTFILISTQEEKIIILKKIQNLKKL